MTNLGSILKSTDIGWLTEVPIVKAMVFPVVMYGYDSWIVKEGLAPKNLCFQIVVLEKTLVSPLDSKEVNQSILKEINSENFNGRTDAF